jgi:hypothetical protein
LTDVGIKNAELASLEECDVGVGIDNRREGGGLTMWWSLRLPAPIREAKIYFYV